MAIGAPLEIIISKDSAKLEFPPGESTHYSARFLEKHILEATGEKPVISYEKAKLANSRKIYVGETEMAKKTLGSLQQLAPEELAIIPIGNDLVICGEISKDGLDRGTLFGVYEFLERQLGIRWLYPTDSKWGALGEGTYIPKNQTLTFPKESIRSKPCYRRREGGVSYYYSKRGILMQWHPILRFGCTLPHKNANHTQINWVDLYGQSHPEYFAKDHSQKPAINWHIKNRTFICLSSDAVLRQMLQNIEEYDKKNPTVAMAFGPRPPEENAVYFCTNDGMTLRNVCKCPACMEKLSIKGKENRQGNELFWSFIEKYANEVAQRWPERRLATLAYSFWIDPPVQAKVPKNVDITYVGPLVHYNANPSNKKRHEENMKQWLALLEGNKERLSNWLNIVSPSTYTSSVPFQYPHLFQELMQFTKDKSSGYFINGFNPYRKGRGEDIVINSIQSFPMVWLQAKLLWNPDANVDALVQEYCRTMFAEASDEITELFRLVAHRWETLYQENTAISELDFIHQVRFPIEVVEQMKKLLAQAHTKATGNELLLNKLNYYEEVIYGRFFRESEEYHRRGGRLTAYECCYVNDNQNIPWQNIPKSAFSKSRMGGKPEFESSIQMAHSKDKLFIHIRFKNARPKDELRIENALVFAPVRNMFAPNINRNWKTFKEARIDQKGNIVNYGAIAGLTAQVTKEDKDLIFDVTIPLSSLAQSDNLRLQFMRYWDVWNDYDLWAPTFSGISDFPTWRFGLVELLPDVPEETDGLQ